MDYYYRNTELNTKWKTIVQLKFKRPAQPDSPADKWGLPLRYSPHLQLTLALGTEDGSNANRGSTIQDQDHSQAEGLPPV